MAHHFAAFAISAALFLPTAGWAQDVGAELDALNKEVISLHRKGQYDQAIIAARRALVIAESKLGPEHQDVAICLNRLAVLYVNQGQYSMAAPLYKRSLAIREKALGPEHPDVASSLNNLATLYRHQGQYALAEEHIIQALEIWAKTLGTEHSEVAIGLNNLAHVFASQGMYAEAEKYFLRSLAIREKIFGPEHPAVAESLNNLASIYDSLGRYAQSELLLKRSLRIFERVRGSEHPDVATSLNNLAENFAAQGKYVQAGSLYKRSLAIREKALGPEHPDVASSLNNLAMLYRAQGQFELAEPLLQRALLIWVKALGPEHPDVATGLNNLAMNYRALGQDSEAEQLYKRSLTIREKTLGFEHPHVAMGLINLAMFYGAQNQYELAESHYQRALSILEKALGSEHPFVATNLNNLALLYGAQTQYARAEPLLKRALVIRANTLGADHPQVATSLDNLAFVLDGQQRSNEALEYSTLAYNLFLKRFTLLTSNAFGSTAEQKTKRGALVLHLKRLERIREVGYSSESFEVFQLAQVSSVGRSVAQMAVRLAAQGGELAQAIREQQDIAERLARIDNALIQAIGQPPEKYDAARVTGLREELVTLEKALAEQSRTIASRFPEYDALMSPAPVPAAEAQKLLRPEEALVAYLVDEKGVFAWVMQPNRTDFHRLDITAQELTNQVSHLRAQLDPTQNSKLQPLDEKAANVLYLKVFAPLESALRDVRHVILVPDGALLGLPFTVLVSKVATDSTPASWLADRYAFSSVPSVSALRALRTFTRTKPGTEPFIGFGDPVLEGGKDKQRKLAARSFFAASDASDTRKPFSGIADVRAIRMAPPLPDTADELRMLAKALAAPMSSLYLRDKATEANAKQHDLSKYLVLAFATHGVMAGEMNGAVEPGLILTPPKEGTLLDDGYLTASEVAQLKLNADWVLLSACNTAAPDGTPGAEGLSGLAKAFFYAGARSLLVSNWYVVSDAAVRLTTEMLKRYAADPKLGKAEALKLSMQKLRSDRKYAHPLFWAPFSIVGEGGAGNRIRVGSRD